MNPIRYVAIALFLAFIVLALNTARASDKDVPLYNPSIIEREVLKFVLEPCMAVRMVFLLNTDFYSDVTVDDAEVYITVDTMTLGQDYIKEAENKFEGTNWTFRRKLYPMMLRQCLNHFARSPE